MTEIPILEIRSIHMSYGQTELLRDVNLEVLKGEILALVGPNGAGTVSYTHLTLPTILLV